jgi:hypothetical protein
MIKGKKKRKGTKEKEKEIKRYREPIHGPSMAHLGPIQCRALKAWIMIYWTIRGELIL